MAKVQAVVRALPDAQAGMTEIQYRDIVLNNDLGGLVEAFYEGAPHELKEIGFQGAFRPFTEATSPSRLKQAIAISDATGIQNGLTDFSEKSFMSVLEQDRMSGLSQLFERDGKVLGYLLAAPSRSGGAYIYNIGVDTKTQSGGIGTALMYDLAKRLGEEAGPDAPISLSVETKNVKAVKWYEALGFVLADEVRTAADGRQYYDYVGKASDVMEKAKVKLSAPRSELRGDFEAVRVAAVEVRASDVIAPETVTAEVTPQALEQEYKAIKSLTDDKERQDQVMAYAAALAGRISGKAFDPNKFKVIQSPLFQGNPSFYNETKKQIAINADLFVGIQDGPIELEAFRSLIGTLVKAMIHEDVHAIQDKEGRLKVMGDMAAEEEAYLATIEAMQALDNELFADNPQYAGQIDFLKALLELYANRAQLIKENKGDLVKMIEQIVIGTGELALPTDARIGQIITEVIAYKGKDAFGNIQGMTKLPETLDELEKMTHRVANPKHASILVSQNDLTDSKLVERLQKLSEQGFTIVVHTPENLRTLGGEKISWVAWVAAALTKDQFVKLFGVSPDADGRFFQVEECFVDKLARLISEIMSRQVVASAA
jgi:ribosomal protein S18 acetylase RimI-like enzyme